jgi:Trk K+ transport system NAD-binding subunit
VDAHTSRTHVSGEPTDRHRHFIVCGDNPLAYRLIDELVHTYDAQVTAILASRSANWAPRICQIPTVDVIDAERLDGPTFERAGLAHADAVALIDQEDAGNVDAALLAQEINPQVRIVIRMFNVSLGERMTELLPNCTVLSAAAIAAPAFVAAALDETTTATMRVADRELVATLRGNVPAEDVVAGLAIIAGATEPAKLPAADRESAADLVLARSRRVAGPRRRRRRRPVRALSLVLGPRVRLALVALLGLFLLGTIVIALVKRVSWAEAAYIALLTELGGATADADSSGPERIMLVLLTFVSIAVIPLFTAVLVDSVVKARLRIEAGGLVEPVSGHMVVVGLGDVGTRVVRALTDAGVTVVAVERDPQARGVQVARDLHIPLIIGDASRSEVLQAASVSTCHALVVLSTDDVTNLETGLLGRAVNPSLRVVMRLFDGDFADRVQRAFGINITRSVSYLAAPAFAAAMVSRQVIATIPVRRRVLLVAEIPVAATSDLDGAPAGSLRRPGHSRLIAVRSGAEPAAWLPADDRLLRADDRLFVVCTRAGLGTLVAQALPPHPDTSGPPRRSWPDGRDAPPPLGPADAATIRTA